MNMKMILPRRRARSLVRLLAAGALLQAKGVQVSDAVAFLWPGNNLGKWLIEIACLTLFTTLARRGL